MMSAANPDPNESGHWESAHVFPNCGHVINLSEKLSVAGSKGRSHATLQMIKQQVSEDKGILGRDHISLNGA